MEALIYIRLSKVSYRNFRRLAINGQSQSANFGSIQRPAYSKSSTKMTVSIKVKQSKWHVATAAEAMAAGQFARFGYDVSVQYGANQPEYDLMIASGSRMLKVSVKGSCDGAWGLTQSQLARHSKQFGETDYSAAADEWLKRHASGTAMCFVQFKKINDDELPRIYIAWPVDVAKVLKAAREGKGVTKLIEPEWVRRRTYFGVMPSSWKMTRERVNRMLSRN